MKDSGKYTYTTRKLQSGTWRIYVYQAGRYVDGQEDGAGLDALEQWLSERYPDAVYDPSNYQTFPGDTSIPVLPAPPISPRHVFSIRLTWQERDKYQTLAQVRGVSLGEWAREAMMRQADKEERRQRLLAAVAEEIGD